MPSREAVEHLLRCRAEDLAVVRGARERKRPLFDTPIWRDEHGIVTARAGGGERYVMVEFERPLMEASAAILCRNGGEILNVGFGLGLIDEAIERSPNVTRHVIVEAHVRILEWMREAGWMSRPRVEVIASRWEDVPWARFSGRFDGVFFDPFPFEHAVAPDVWRTIVRTILKPNGVLVLYNPQIKLERAEELARMIGGRLETHPCTVDVTLLVDEWVRHGLGPSTIDICAIIMGTSA